MFQENLPRVARAGFFVRCFDDKLENNVCLVCQNLLEGMNLVKQTVAIQEYVTDL